MSQSSFGQAAADSYDDRVKHLAPLRDALQFVTRLALSELPADAHVLCVGAGTGAELLDLAEAFPGWRFTAVDPSAFMLRRCQLQAEQTGVGGRCTLHHGTVSTLGGDTLFDGATSLLVSQFVVDPAARRQFFQAIADRLKPRAPLVTADLAAPAPLDELLKLWKRTGIGADAPKGPAPGNPPTMGEQVAVLPPADVESLITAGGFDAPIRCFQGVLIHGWLARRRG